MNPEVADRVGAERASPRRGPRPVAARSPIALGALVVALAAQVVGAGAVQPGADDAPAARGAGGRRAARRRRRRQRAGALSAARALWGFRCSPAAASGAVHLIGPTGGYLLAFPVAAGVTGALRRRPRHRGQCCRVLLACALGMVDHPRRRRGAARAARRGPGAGVPHRLRSLPHRRSAQGRPRRGPDPRRRPKARALL